jgi:hypothetical protein
MEKADKKPKFYVNNLRVASPCSVGWETMSGDERVRRCHSCELNIYNIAEMTSKEIESLIVNREDRVCISLYKRADGTVLTKDCPVGFRAYQKRATRFAGAALATILGLFSVSFGQKADEKFIKASEIKIVKIVKTANQKSVLTGMIYDHFGAVIPGIAIKLYKAGTKKPLKSKTNEDGEAIFHSLSPGFYVFEAEAKNYRTTKITDIEIKDNEESRFEFTLEQTGTITVGIYGDEPLIDNSSTGLKTVFVHKQNKKLPH